jgi:hypothetical protein
MNWFRLFASALLAFSFFLNVSPVQAAGCEESVPAPQYQTGDRWVWQDEKGVKQTREIIGFEDNLAKVKWTNPRLNPDKEGVLFIDGDNVTRKAIRPNGEVITKQGAGTYVTIGQKLMDFPLHIGKEWSFSWTAFPSSGGGALTQYTTQYKVLACDEIATPAGKFSTFKIEATQANGTYHTSGTFFMWYAPTAKAVVKTQYVTSRYWYNPLDNELVELGVK